MNALKESSEELPQEPKAEPQIAWVVAWDGVKQVKLHKILNQLDPPQAVLESSGSVFTLEMAANVYLDERNACLAGWMKRMEEAALSMKRAETFKKRADELRSK